MKEEGGREGGEKEGRAKSGEKGNDRMVERKRQEQGEYGKGKKTFQSCYVENGK